ncbi:hypothetical protein CA13_66150 [Planctomycetes bacterium CA13]|uniref:Uncharacterized protein n=1 Tax=Novipirellula herctigrandis TaxID=2527986 RepID=A0A5C5ZF09_9BACT|nr:hypothetical protein CA13_66150 [Planctomycetes bacterium CA13]
MYSIDFFGNGLRRCSFEDKSPKQILLGPSILASNDGWAISLTDIGIPWGASVSQRSIGICFLSSSVGP